MRISVSPDKAAGWQQEHHGRQRFHWSRLWELVPALLGFIWLMIAFFPILYMFMTKLAAWRDRARDEPRVDVLISPTLGLTEIPPEDVDELEIRVPFSAYTRVFSFLGWPAIAIGGVQIAAREPDALFAAALAWERSYGPPA